MIEVIYKEENPDIQEGEEGFCLPRNIRQIGVAGEKYKIYMEDYVYTFLIRLARTEENQEVQKGRVAVLIGEIKWKTGTAYLFIRGAVMAEDMEAAVDHVDFSVQVWKQIHEDQKKYFEDQEIVGWFFSQPRISMEATELLEKVHLKHFGGEKVLMLMEPQESEDAFFRYENNTMIRLEGYYLYYEKNICMQNYMVEKNEKLQLDLTEKYEDRAVKDFRKIITEKTKEEKEKNTVSVFSYAVPVCLAIAVLTVGMNFYRNFQNPGYSQDQSKTASSVIIEEITPSPTPKIEKKSTDNEKIKKKTIKSKENEKKEVSVQQTPKPANQTGEIDQSDKTEQIYREEADTRKAQKRMREELQKENETAASESVHESYVIQPGDTLFQISLERYGDAKEISRICALNGIKEDEIIYPGQVIVLP